MLRSISSSLSRNLFSSAISSHLDVFGPRDLFFSLDSYSESCLMNVALISRSGLLEFKNSSVLRRLQRYFLIRYVAITQDARDCPLTEWMRTLSYSVIASSTKGNISLVVVGVLASAIAAFFYIRVIIMMFFTDPVNDSVSVIIPSVKSKISISASLLISLVLGIAPSLLLTTAGNYANFIR